MNSRILVVAGMPGIHEDFRNILSPPEPAMDPNTDEEPLFGRAPGSGRARFEVTSAYQETEALEKVRACQIAALPFAMAFVDVRPTPVGHGAGMIERLWLEDPQLQIVACVASTDPSSLEVFARLDTRDRLLILKRPFGTIEAYQFAIALAMKWHMTEQTALMFENLERAVEARTQALEQSRDMFRLMAESTQAIPFMLNLTHSCFPYIGAKGIADFGIPELQWKEPGTLDIVIPRDFNQEIRQRFDECESGPFEFVTPLTLPGGRRTEVRWTGTCEWVKDAKFLRGLMLDITELRRLGRELAAAQKLESVGRLAAGVAHEINTPIQFVSDNVRFVRTSMSDMVPVVEAYRTLQHTVQAHGNAQAAIAMIDAARLAAAAEEKADLDYILENAPRALDSSIDGLERVATIVRSMKQFAHPDQAEKTYADLNQAIQSTLVIANNEYKFVAQLQADFGELPPVQCYLGEINQVVLNLLVNASHAIADVVKGTNTMGTLTVRTRLDGDDVQISISDTGTGIPSAVRDKIFDPFFTTKEVGKGTGQGLAMAHSVIVGKHGGTLRFETESGKGTTFFIRLPIDARMGTTPVELAAA